MNKPSIISGIELGSSKIVAIIAQVPQNSDVGDDEINVLGVATGESRGIKKGQIVNIEEAVESALSPIEAAERMAGCDLQEAYISLGGAHITSQNSHGVVAVSDPEGEISENDVERVVEAAQAVSLPSNKEIIHVLPREFVVDGESGIKDPISMSGVRLEVETHLIIASAAAIKNLRKAVNELGIQAKGFVFAGLAAAEAVLTPTEKELGCVLIDIGGGTTSIAAFVDGALSFSGVIPIGAKNVTNDLAIGLRVTLESAERIKLALSNEAKKVKKGFSEEMDDKMDIRELGIDGVKKVSRKTLIEGIIRPRLNEIFTMVRIELEKVDLINRVPSGAVITGGGAMTVGVLESARRILSLPVRVGRPNRVKGLVDDILNPAFAAPVGLLHYAQRYGDYEPRGGLTNRLSHFKLPSVGIANKLIDFIKDLLP